MKKIIFAVILTFSICFPAFSSSPFKETSVIPAESNASNDSETEKKLGAKILEALKRKTTKLFAKIRSIGKNSNEKQLIDKSFKIPGHENKNFVCQGICHIPQKKLKGSKCAFKNVALLSYYPKTEYTNHPSQLVAINLDTGKAIARFPLFFSSTKAYKGHAGGIAIAGNTIWVASGYQLTGFDLNDILGLLSSNPNKVDIKKISPASFQIPTKEIASIKVFKVDSSASYLSFDGECLWTGDFVKSSNKSYQPIKHHKTNPWKKETWIAGYKVNDDGFPTSCIEYNFVAGGKSRRGNKPDKVICCRESVQGMAVFNNHIALSISYGAANSKLAIYKSPLNSKANRIEYSPSKDKTFSVDGYVLADKVNWKTFSLPAGSEDLEFDGASLFVTFEGASPNYCTKWKKLNPLVKIEKNFYLLNSKKLIQEVKKN